MKRLLVFLVLALGSLVQAAPPKLTALPSGEFVIVTGSTTLTIQKDGSVVVKSPTIDLTIPATDGPAPGPNPPGPNPPAPQPDKLEGAIKALWGGLQEADMKANAKALAVAYNYAAEVVESKLANTPDDVITLFASKQKGLTKPGALLSIQERIEGEINTVYPDQSKPLTPESRVAGAALFRKAATILEGLSNGPN